MVPDQFDILLAAMTLTDDELDRYARHIVLREIGGSGQAHLTECHALLIGAGGIGSPAIQYLAAAGLGQLTVIDNDSIALSNLQRQTLYATREIGRRKVDAAAEAVARLNPGVAFEGITERLDRGNAIELLGAAMPDVILDGSDNFETRLAVADTAYRLRIPLVSAAVSEFEGQLGVFRGWERDKPCYRCFVGHDPGRADVSCSEQGVLGALTGMMGSLAALEVIRALVPFGEDSAGKLLLADALALRFRTLDLPKDPGCFACAG